MDGGYDNDQAEIDRVAAATAAEAAAAAPIEAKPDEPKTGVDQTVERWWADHFEGKPALHPVPYLSGAWHYARDAKDDLKARLKAIVA